jgi:hypothetical protein
LYDPFVLARRSLVAAASSLMWPAILVVIPVVITLRAARVYAEAGVAPPACTEAVVSACADAGAMQACDCREGQDCACTQTLCLAGSTAKETLVCASVASSCKLYAVAPCEGKAAGASCVQTDTAGAPVASGTCGVLSNGCQKKNDAGQYELAFPLACAASLNDAGASTPKGDDASGCSFSPRAMSDWPVLATPFALGLAVARRRKRRR